MKYLPLFALFLAACTDPASVFITGSILGYEKGAQYAFVLPILPLHYVAPIGGLDSNGRFSAGMKIGKVSWNDTLILKKNGKEINRYLVEKNLKATGADSYQIKDLGNKLTYEIEGTGPFRISNLILMPKMAFKASEDTVLLQD